MNNGLIFHIQSKPVFIIAILFLVCFAFPSAFATASISLDNPQTTSSGGINSAGQHLNVIITILDDNPKFITNNKSDSITVTVESDADGSSDTELVLLETGPNSGEFKNTNFLFLLDDSTIVSDTSMLTVSLDKTVDAAGNPTGFDADNKVTTWPFFEVRTSSEVDGIPVLLTETSPNSGIFQETVQLGDSTDETLNLIKAKPGDVVTFNETLPATKNFLSNLLVAGSTDKTISAIVAAQQGKNTVSVTATYVGETNTDSVTVDVLFTGPGGGVGGPVPSSLVIDSVNPTADTDQGSGCSGDCIPPTLGINQNDNRIVTDGFSYNGNPVDVELYYTPYPLITANVGEENVTVLKVYDNSGTQNIKHVGLAFGLGKGESFNDSKATINLDRKRDGTESVTVYDPENALDNIKVVTEKGRCSDSISGAHCLIVSIHHMFRDTLNFNMVATYVWDFNLNSWQNYYNHGIHIVGDSLNPPRTDLVYFGTKDMHGMYELTRIDKLKDLWQDEFGNIYQYKGNDRYDKVYSEPKPIVYDKPTSHGCDRHCNWFAEYKLEQEYLAKIKLIEMLNGKIIEGEPLEDPITIFYHFVDRRDDPVLQQNIKNEMEKAENLFDLIYENPYS